MTSLQLLQLSFLTASVHNDGLEIMLQKMQLALDLEQRQEAALLSLEAECNAAHNSLERMTAMAGALTAATSSRSAPNSAPPTQQSAATLNAKSSMRVGDALQFAKQASTFTLDDCGPTSQPTGKHLEANASVTRATANLAALRHQLAVAEHSSVRRRLLRIEGQKQRINKGLTELSQLLPLLEGTDLRAAQRQLYEQLFAVPTSLKPSSSATATAPKAQYALIDGDVFDSCLQHGLNVLSHDLDKAIDETEHLLQAAEECDRKRDGVSMVYEAALAVAKMGEINMPFYCDLEAVLADDDSVANHYESLLDAYFEKNEDAHTDGEAQPPVSLPLSTNPSIPLPPDCEMHKLLDPYYQDPEGRREPAPILPPARHILHHRFTYRGAAELKKLESCRIDCVRGYLLGALAKDAYNDVLAANHSQSAGVPSAQRDQASLVEQLRFSVATKYDMRLWPAVASKVPEEDK